MSTMSSSVATAAKHGWDAAEKAAERLLEVASSANEELQRRAAEVVGEDNASYAVYGLGFVTIASACAAAVRLAGRAGRASSKTKKAGQAMRVSGRRRKRVLGVIPAGFYSAARFPGKPLAMVLGKPMIQRVYEEAGKAATLDRLVVATDDEQIYRMCKTIGAEVVMVTSTCEEGLARCHEAVRSLPESFDIVVHIHGDEPLIQASMIDETVLALQTNPSEMIATAVAPTAPTAPPAGMGGIKDDGGSHVASKRNRVKCAMDIDDNALYFSRSVLPCSSRRQKADPTKTYFIKLGILCIDTRALGQIFTEPMKRHGCPLYDEEGVEEVRLLELMFNVKAVVSREFYHQHTVEEPQDISIVEKILRSEMS